MKPAAKLSGVLRRSPGAARPKREHVAVATEQQRRLHRVWSDFDSPSCRPCVPYRRRRSPPAAARMERSGTRPITSWA